MTSLTGTVPEAFVSNLLAGVARAGHDPVKILSQTNLHGHTGDIPVLDYVQLVRWVTHTLDDELSGLAERPQRVGTFALMAAHASHAETAGEALRRLAEFMALMDNSYRFRFVEDKRASVFLAQSKKGVVHPNSLMIETTMVMTHRLVSWLCDSWIPIVEAHFDYARPDYAAAYKLLVPRALVRFDQRDCRLIFPADALQSPVLRTETQAIGWAKRVPLDAFLPVRAATKLALQVAEEIRRSLRRSDALPKMHSVAQEIGLPEHTLRRRLKAEGTDYLGIRNQVRRDIAVRLLGTTDQSIEGIAQAAGFSEASAFIRAFKGWTGYTPKSFRANMAT